MPVELLYEDKGRACGVYVRVDHRGRKPVLEMVSKAGDQEQKRFMAQVRRLTIDRPWDIPTCSIADSRHDIWYCRATKHIRAWFICDGRRVVILHSLYKTKRPTDPHAVERARELAEQYRQERGCTT